MTDYERGKLCSQAQHVTRPGAFRKGKGFRDTCFMPSENEVETCLSCPLPVCTNCMSGRGKTVSVVTKVNKIRKCLEENISVPETCRVAGVSRATFYRLSKMIMTA